MLSLSRIMLTLAAAVVATAAPRSDGYCATNVTQHGITWTFSSDCQTGQFVTGDYWIVDSGTGCVLTNVSNNFHSVDLSTVDYDGSQLNAMWTAEEISRGQGLDSRVSWYKSSANINKNLPFTLTHGNSLLTAISWLPGDVGIPLNVATGGVPQVKRIAILTCLSSAPPAGSFRPSYASGSKTVFSSEDVNISSIPLLPSAGTNISSLTSAIVNTSGPWTDLFVGYQSQYLRPTDNYNGGKGNAGTYNRYVAEKYGDAALKVFLDGQDQADRQTLIYQLVQIGIDYYGVLQCGGAWYADGGHQHGYKLPILFAGKLLNNEGMLAVGQDYLPQTNTFQDDSTLFTITEDLMYPNRTVCGVNNGSPPCFAFYDDRQYSGENGITVGLPEWGATHPVYQHTDNASADAAYRVINGGPLAMHALAALILGLDGVWNNNLFFAYHDRFMSAVGLGKMADNAFGQKMWEMYRHAYRQYWPARPARRLSLAGRPIKLAEPGP